MSSFSYLLQNFCGISFAVLTFYLNIANVEHLHNYSFIGNLQSSKSNLKTSANKIDFGSVFKEFDVEGAIVIYDASKQKFYEHNSPRNSKAFFPASTFKILNTLVALETGVIKDEVAILTWDGIKRNFDTWNRDTNLRQGFP